MVYIIQLQAAAWCVKFTDRIFGAPPGAAVTSFTAPINWVLTVPNLTVGRVERSRNAACGDYYLPTCPRIHAHCYDWRWVLLWRSFTIPL